MTMVDGSIKLLAGINSTVSSTAQIYCSWCIISITSNTVSIMVFGFWVFMELSSLETIIHEGTTLERVFISRNNRKVTRFVGTVVWMDFRKGTKTRMSALEQHRLPLPQGQGWIYTRRWHDEIGKFLHRQVWIIERTHFVVVSLSLALCSYELVGYR